MHLRNAAVFTPSPRPTSDLISTTFEVEGRVHAAESAYALRFEGTEEDSVRAARTTFVLSRFERDAARVEASRADSTCPASTEDL